MEKRSKACKMDENAAYLLKTWKNARNDVKSTKNIENGRER
jgi:hypothetical protein